MEVRIGFKTLFDVQYRRVYIYIYIDTILCIYVFILHLYNASLILTVFSIVMVEI